MFADERIDGGDGDARDGERVLVLLLEFGRNDAMIGGMSVVVPKLEHAFRTSDGEIVRLDAIEEPFAAKNIAEHGERFLVWLERKNPVRMRQDVREDVSGITDVGADVENVAGAKEFGIALGESPERIFVVALVKKGSGEKSALNGTEFEHARLLHEVVGPDDGVRYDFITHGSHSRVGMSCGA